MAEVFDKYYSIQIASHSLSQYLKETNVDNESKNAVNVIGSQWMDLVLLPKILENHEYRFELQVNKNRLYPDKRRNGVAYWSINSNCRLKLCVIEISMRHCGWEKTSIILMSIANQKT